jgi:hypothetical protein
MQQLVDYFTQDFSRSDLIALAALGVAALSAIYAKRQSKEARKARISAEREARRPQRLEIFQAMEEYCRYCGTYYTAYLQGEVTGTRNLAVRIEEFRRTIAHGAINDMPPVAAEFKVLESLGWQMQRHIDRLGIQPTVIQRGTEAKEDERKVEEIVLQFDAHRQGLSKVFSSYLNAEN